MYFALFMDLSGKKYPSKVLLFGEYTVIDGGSALAIPYPKYTGQWKSRESSDLAGFLSFVKSIEGVNIREVEKAINQNWIFESDIPQGYGLGSSGALSAAAYDSFFQKKELSTDMIKERLSEIESFFHGKSSGLDPLVSYLNAPVLYENGHCTSPANVKLPRDIYLFDSQMRRDTKYLVAYYKEQKNSDANFRSITKELSELNSLVIHALLESKETLFYDCFSAISRLQYDSFQKMIPGHIGKVWSEGLNCGKYYMKLSGAGGGGFFLFLGNPENIEKNKILAIS